MKLATTKGININQPLIKKEIVVRTENALGYKTLSLCDEEEGVMLVIRLNEEVEKMLKELFEVKE